MKTMYTAQEMREMALVEESYGWDVVAKMLLQAADMMEREATREKSSAVGNAAAMSEGGVPRMIRHDLYAKAINGVPRVRLVDGSGKEIYRGYYFAYPEYQGYPIVAEGEKPEEIPLVEGIVTYDPGDWGLSNTPRVLKVTPPHRLELIPEGEL